MAKKYVYMFNEGNAKMREILGGKGANLAEMTRLKLPVPYGFTVSTEACNEYYRANGNLTDTMVKQILASVEKVEKHTGKTLGSLDNPLLLSVRSGARASMPGMMDSILNLGLNDTVVETLAKLTNNERFAFDSYRRFIMMFSDVVMGIDRQEFESEVTAIKQKRGIKKDLDLTADDFKELVKKNKAIYKRHKKADFPSDPKEQLLLAVQAVFRSWNNERAIVYRRMNDIPAEWGTAVNVQTMVFGNMGETSGTGVAFTRNPSTGEKVLYGEYLMNAQGEDVVAGVRTPNHISDLEKQNPEVYAEFKHVCEVLEERYRDMQDMEFTIENGKLFMLQTRNGKRTAKAALRIAIDLVNEKKISKKDALLMIDPKSLDSLLHPTFIDSELKKQKPISNGLPASPGAGSGVIALNYQKALEYKEKGLAVVLVRNETSPEDIKGMAICRGVLTATGGMTSHAAVVARGMGTCCVAGCTELSVDEENGQIKLNGKTLKEGDYLSIDGNTGNIYACQIPTEEAKITGDFATIMSWADECSKIKVRANADTPKDAKRALELGATGVGLCRTEHMFFGDDRIKSMRQMILSDDKKDMDKALRKLEAMQKNDFEGILKTSNGLPVTVRYLDPPLHEFLPHTKEDMQDVADLMGKSVEDIEAKVETLKEFNPMMGFRGCRLAIVRPEIATMQTEALIHAGINVQKKTGVPVDLEIMVPLVGDVKELQYVKNIIVSTAEKIIKESGNRVKYRVGTMIEVPRACVKCEEIAREADFFSFGTNDLTQLTYGFSRDDAGKFLPSYLSRGILENDPFVRLDEKGVGELIRSTVARCKKKKGMEFGVCGEQGADPKSVEFFLRAGLDYVSCSPYRVPVARLSCCQATLRLK